ncbi:MAG: methyltransferase domain-containing protein [Planctomycetota bacterium]
MPASEVTARERTKGRRDEGTEGPALKLETGNSKLETRTAGGANAGRATAGRATAAPPFPTAGCLLNLGCGALFHAQWVNLDLRPAASSVVACDLREGIPLPVGACAAVYHAHLLEHLPRAAGLELLGECRRVLRPGGVLRVVVPDLEAIARLYLAALEGAAGGDPAAARRHEWLVLELYDQCVRERPGGEMAAHLRAAAHNPDRAAFAVERLGEEARAIIGAARSAAPAAEQHVPARRWGVGAAIAHLRGRAHAMLDRERRRTMLARRLLGRAGYTAYQLGRFRQSGEVHQWMYDRHSLAVALEAAGFVRLRRVAADESAIPGWPAYGLDVDAAGNPRKPDSLYMEARRD